MRGMSIVVAAVFVASVLVYYAYKSIRPPPPKICGSPGGPPVTSPRIKLSDGRHLAYKENGVPKADAKYKVILIHGFYSSKDTYLPLSKEVMEELGVYVLTYDRAGYVESDPNPEHSVKSEAFDIQELADKLNLGSKFYVIGGSIGTYPVWGCLKYIPHRLAGAAVVSPSSNFWWPSFPPKLVGRVYRSLLKRDQVKYWIAHNAPGLFYWWMTQRWFPYCSMMQGASKHALCKSDLAIIEKISQLVATRKAVQQGEYLSVFQDKMVMHGKWEFDPMELENPYAENESSVHLWQGLSDQTVSMELVQYIAKKLPWIKYHEVPHAAHWMIHDSCVFEAIVRQLLLPERT